MKPLLTSLTLSLFLVACSGGSNYPADATQSEINMAEMMGISVEELRAQTPEEHMQMMMDMQHNQ